MSKREVTIEIGFDIYPIADASINKLCNKTIN